MSEPCCCSALANASLDCDPFHQGMDPVPLEPAGAWPWSREGLGQPLCVLILLHPCPTRALGGTQGKAWNPQQFLRGDGNPIYGKKQKKDRGFYDEVWNEARQNNVSASDASRVWCLSQV